MSMSKSVINKGLKHVLEPKTVHAGYIVDERGNEVQITTSMVRHVCHQLLKQCRTVKN
ncbi:PA1571 family protein [Acinetobacter wanghuae]|uniref:PA1571 family protein n=1 Tax=Acinetobacter wanghuae TaxID=2662362 RepID=UPI00338DF7D6